MSQPPPKPQRKKAPADEPPGVQRPENEEVWMKCRAKNSCEGNRARVLLKKNQGLQGTWIQYVCLTCNTPFSVHV